MSCGFANLSFISKLPSFSVINSFIVSCGDLTISTRLEAFRSFTKGSKIVNLLNLSGFKLFIVLTFVSNKILFTSHWGEDPILLNPNCILSI